uniref:histone acetyltransferase n=1 Tax=Albugo laibachii Nc14 TaxID=890382 RepID=F0WT92_9STRA|nr:histone acetyltransferase putative [Albugo laibachii Nc14]|eukprot:CCA24581.1 histone acetyltransferase putative [Albugo laibachii Nc14]
MKSNSFVDELSKSNVEMDGMFMNMDTAPTFRNADPNNHAKNESQPLNGLEYDTMMTMSTTNFENKLEGIIGFPDELQSPKPKNHTQIQFASPKKTVPSSTSSLANSDTTAPTTTDSSDDSLYIAIPFPASLDNTATEFGASNERMMEMNNHSHQSSGGGSFNFDMVNDGAYTQEASAPTTAMYHQPDTQRMREAAYHMNTGGINAMNQINFQQQQQQQYLRMMQQQRHLAAIQQQNALLQAQQAQSAYRQSLMMRNEAHNALSHNGHQNFATMEGTPMGTPNSQAQGKAPMKVKHQPWHSPADHILRKEMVHHIIRLLQAQKKNSSVGWMQKLPAMAKRLEEECYGTAVDREEYANTNTLHSRLRAIVRAAQKGPRQTQADAAKASVPVTAPSRETQVQSRSTQDLSPIPFPGEAQSTPSPVPTASMPQMNYQEMVMNHRYQNQLLQMPAEMQDQRDSLNGLPQQQHTPQAAQTAVKSLPENHYTQTQQDSFKQMNSGNLTIPASHGKSALIIRQFRAKAHQVTSLLAETRTREYHRKLQSITTAEISQNAESKNVLRRQQERLLILRHAMWCKSTKPECEVLAVCREMKRLWEHMSGCQDTHYCKVSHCLSSRYVLSHFQQCVNAKCLVCQVVQFPVEVKEEDGRLMLDADRIMQQIGSITRNRQAHVMASMQSSNSPFVPVPGRPHSHEGLSNSKSVPSDSRQPSSWAPTASDSVTHTAAQGRPSPATPTDIDSNCMQPPHNTSMPMDDQSFFHNVSEEERRQLTAIHEKIQIWSLDQLLAHCQRVEGWGGQIRAQMNMIVNECRHMIHIASNSMDANMKAQYNAQIATKKGTLKTLDTKYKRCSLQHRLVKNVIFSKQNGFSANSNGMISSVPVDCNTGQLVQPEPTQEFPAPWLQGNGPVPIPFDNMTHTEQPQVYQQEMMDSSVFPVVSPDITDSHNDKPLEMPLELQDTRKGETSKFSSSKLMGKHFNSKEVSGTNDVLSQCKQSIKVKQEPTNQNFVSCKEKDDDVKVEIKSECDSGNEKCSNSISTSKKKDPSPRSLPSSNTATPISNTTDVSTSMLNELSNENLRKHIESLVKYYNSTLPMPQLKKRLEVLLKGMMEHKFGWVFSSPVDTVALEIPDYFRTIRRPMDLGTIKKKLDLGFYKHIQHFASDVRLTFNNAKLYNSEGSDVHNLAKDMLNDFNVEFRKLEIDINEQERLQRLKEAACRLCGVERMLFEPSVLYCNGECNARIRRNCYYYASVDNKYHCCHPCYGNLGDAVKSTEGQTYNKSSLCRKKNDEVHEEPWVQCDKCNRWVHQVCALFNGKIDAEKKPATVKTEDSKAGATEDNSPSNGVSAKEMNVKVKPEGARKPARDKKSGGPSSASISNVPGGEFLCPECLLEHRLKEPGKYRVTRHAFSAKDLMRTKLSDYLERWIAKVLQEEREDEAVWTNQDASRVFTAENLTIRQVSNIDKQLMVRDKMFFRYKESHNYSSDFRFKSKCICMFQEIHGVSVLLFGMYVHEFDEQEAPANARRVYISYLDSVSYFEPSHLRTKVYHELLIAYLDFVKKRGFYAAHLWACPPLKGDDYILYCHPETQKTPKSERLRQWYVDMLVKAQEKGIVWHITNMYDDYWRNNNPACKLPYFEGDYWVGLAEDLIEKIESEQSKKATSKKTASSKRKTSKKLTMKTKAKKQKRRKSGSSLTSASPKQSQWNGHGGDSEDEDVDLDSQPNTKETLVAQSSESIESSPHIGYKEPETNGKRKKRISLEVFDRTVTDPLMVRLGEVIYPMKDDFLVVKLQPFCFVCNVTAVKGTLWVDSGVKTEHGLYAKIVQFTLCDTCYQNAKKDSTPKERVILETLVPQSIALPSKCTDLDEINDNEFFDTRQAFLSLCQGNHYQFDELRRAKHSSMMALYHLGNPNPNAYVYECNKCAQDIISGNRWHCKTCPDFDVCDYCHTKEKHRHPLQLIVVAPNLPSSKAVAGQSLTTGDFKTSQQQRRSREAHAKTVRLHLQLLVHSSSCIGGCASTNCEKMKELMRHGAQCKQRAYGGCTICRRVWALLQLHSRQCRQNDCKVPRCADLREHFRKLQLQQQLMDDRRRAAVTHQYRQMQMNANHAERKNERRELSLVKAL